MALSRPTLILETPRACGERGHRFFLARLDVAQELDAAECLAAAAHHPEGPSHLSVCRLVSQVLRGQKRKDAPETLVAAGLPLLSSTQRSALRAHLERCLTVWDQQHATEMGIEQGLRVASPLVRTWENEMVQLLGLKEPSLARAEKPAARTAGCRKFLFVSFIIGIILTAFIGWQIWNHTEPSFKDSPSTFTSSEEPIEQRLRLDRGWRELATNTGLKSAATSEEMTQWEQTITPYLLKSTNSAAPYIKALNGENNRLDATLGRWSDSVPTDDARQSIITFRDFATLVGCASHEEATSLIRMWQESLIEYSSKVTNEKIRASINPVIASLGRLPPPLPSWRLMTPADLQRWRIMSDWLTTSTELHAALQPFLSAQTTWNPALGQNEIEILRAVAAKKAADLATEDIYPEIKLCVKLMSVIKTH
jgi:hypothetical protein